jgi:hypothetical protein
LWTAGLAGALLAVSERELAARYLKRAADGDARRAAAEDIAWTMLNSLEFVFNH